MSLRNLTRLVLNILLAQVLVFSSAWTAQASYQVSGVSFAQGKDGFQVNVQGKNPPTYTVYELFEPMRVVLDIADASFDPAVSFPYTVNQDPVSKIVGRVLADKEPAIAKIEIFLSDDRNYSVNRQGNDIQIIFAAQEIEMPESIVVRNEPMELKEVASRSEEKVELTEMTSEVQANVSAEDQPVATPAKKDLVADLLQSISAPEGKLEKQFKRAGIEQDQFAAAGFKKQKISIDFYKIDLHNVFRLFGEISGSNMIIDQDVKGTLTLALNEVPWDFAMDIILNLKDLQKEERYNTIVISEKSKKFLWPEEPEKALEIKAPAGDVKIAIEQRLEMPPGMLEAKKMMFRAQKLEKEGDFNGALVLYEQALLNWSENGELAKHIASLCLVELGMYSKALHYAKAALKIAPDDNEAALQAAVAAANMRKSEASDYFKLAVSSAQPSQEALVSFASYAEQIGDLDSALAALAKQADIYGDSLESMVAKARIYDRSGQKEKAVAEYKTILFSGYDIDADLKRYIKSRVAVD